MLEKRLDHCWRRGHHIGTDAGCLKHMNAVADAGDEDLGSEIIIVIDQADVADQRHSIEPIVTRACRLAGLTTGPIHAEMRVNEQGVWLLEIAARSIGGLCGRMLRHALGMSLEELLLRHALDLPLPELAPSSASGVMMIPIRKRGLYQGVQNIEAARALPHITEIQITAELNALLLPAPEGASYLGFIFAQADTPQAAEQALRAAHSLLVFDIQTEVPVAVTAA